MKKAGLALACAAIGCVWVSGCGSSPPATGTGSGGNTGSGGAPSSGSGGSTGSGGAPSAGSGGSTGSGGTPTPGSGGAPASDGGGSDTGPAPTGWPAVTDFAARGPFPIQREADTGPGNGYDVMRPATLGMNGRKHPIISWNNGTLYTIDKYQPLLDHLASHGFVVIGAHTNTTAGGKVHKDGIDWLRARNADAASPYHDMLDLARVGAAGHSQGGAATLAASSNKPGTTGITAAIALMPIASTESDLANIITKQAAPLLIISATMDTRSIDVANRTFAAVPTPFIDAEFKGVHEDAMNTAMHAPALAWFRLHLMDDVTAGKAFYYPPGTCGLCRDAGWQMVRYKNTP